MATEVPQVVVRRTFLQHDYDTEARVHARSRAFTDSVLNADSLLDPPGECLSSGSTKDACKEQYAFSDDETASNGRSMPSWSSEADESEGGCDDFVLECQELDAQTPSQPPGQFLVSVSPLSSEFSPFVRFASSPTLSPVSQAPSPSMSPTFCENVWSPLLPKPLREPSSQAAAGGDRTTVMLRNLPNDYDRETFLQLLDWEGGFFGRYDFVYLPVDFQTYACRGYGFVNLVDTEAAAHFLSVFEGYSNWVVPCRKVCGVSWSGPLQGLEAHIKKYRNASVMGPATPDAFKPVLFENGVRKPFPAPTKKLKGC